MKVVVALALSLLMLLGWGGAVASTPVSADLLERGEYVVYAAGCISCHAGEEGESEHLEGGRAFETAFGTFHAPNITPHPEYGIGAWTAEDFRRALREGVAPDGRRYFPVFPYTAYSRMREDDIRAMWAYLSARPTVAKPSRTHDSDWYLQLPLAMRLWRLLHFSPGPWQDDRGRSAQWNRGAYLAEALGHCGECHTPRGLMGNLRADRKYAGTPEGPDGDPVPNITPHPEDGIGQWDQDDLAYFLESGMTPEGDFTGGMMSEVIDNGLRHLSASDREAIATYLLSLPPLPKNERAMAGE
ncbi:MAG: cytochrome c [Gammaproteobacteria bacterium]|nr:cytochrome c [Gammaproteobacteria bacterium]